MDETSHPVGRGMRPENGVMLVSMRSPVPMEGTIRREESGSGEEETQDLGWVMEKVSEYSPELAALLQNGFEATYNDDMLSVVGQWCADSMPDFDLAGMLDQVLKNMMTGPMLLAGAVTGDMACCERIDELTGGMQKSLAAFNGDKGPLQQLQDFMQGRSEKQGLDAGKFLDDLVSGASEVGSFLGVDKVVGAVTKLLSSLSSGVIYIIDKILVAIGLPKLADIPAWLAEKLKQAGEVLLEEFTSWMTSLYEWAGEFQLVQAVAEAGDGLDLAVKAALWLSEHWGDDEIWEKDSKKIYEEFGVLAYGMELAMTAFGAVQTGIQKGSDALSKMKSGLDTVVSNPLFYFVAMLPMMQIPAALVLLLASAGDPFWGELWSGIKTVSSWLLAAGDQIAKASLVLLNPVGTGFATIPAIISLLPECYQIAIIDTLLLLGQTAMGVICLPLLGSPLTAAFYQMQEGFFDQLLAMSHEEKMGVVVGMAQIMSGRFLVDLLEGVVVGLIQGVWEEIKGLLILIAGIVGAVVAGIAAVAAMAVMPLVVIAKEAQRARDMAAKKKKGSEEGEETVELDEKKLAKDAELDAVPGDEGIGSIETAETEPPGTFEGIAGVINGLYEKFSEAMSQFGEVAATGMMKLVKGAGENAYTVGTWAGWAIAIVVIEYALTKGAAAIASGLVKFTAVATKMALALTKVDDLMRLVKYAKTLAGAVDTGFDACIGVLKKVNLPFVDDLVKSLTKVKLALKKWLDDAIAKLTKVADEIKNPKKSPETPGGPPKKGPGEKDGRASEATRLMKDLLGKTKDDLFTGSEIGKAIKREVKSGFGAKLEENKDSWWVSVSKKGENGSKDSSAKGWIGYEKVGDGGKRFYGAVDVEKDNEKAIDAAIVALDDAFDEVDAATGKEAVAALRSDENAEESKFKSVYGKEMLLDLTFDASSFADDKDGDTILVTAFIGPNATKKEKRIKSKSVLEARLRSIGAKEHLSLLQPFTAKDWGAVFGLSSTASSENIRLGVADKRLYSWKDALYLYVPLGEGTFVSELMVGEIDSHRSAFGKEFGLQDLSSYMSGSSLSWLKGDWKGFEKSTMAMMESRSMVVSIGDGKWTFDAGFPTPSPGLHKVKETASKEQLQKTKRHSHHAPAAALAKTWGEELAALVDELQQNSNYADVMDPYIKAVNARGKEFTDAGKTTSGKLTAILLHEDTHKKGKNAVHATNLKSDSEKILGELGEDAIVLRSRGERVFLANPQVEHWKEFIAECYSKVKREEFKPGVTKSMAEQEVAAMEDALGDGENEVRDQTMASIGLIHKTIEESVTSAYTVDRKKIEQALSYSSVDGDQAKHADALTEMDIIHGKSAWTTKLAEPLTCEK